MGRVPGQLLSRAGMALSALVLQMDRAVLEAGAKDKRRPEMERLGNKTYRVEMAQQLRFDESMFPSHLKLTAGPGLSGANHVFEVEADRAYIAEYGMRFYRQGIVFLIIPHAAYRSVRLIECDELLQRMESGETKEEDEIPHNGD